MEGYLEEYITSFKEAGIEVSLFIDPEEDQVRARGSEELGCWQGILA